MPWVITKAIKPSPSGNYLFVKPHPALPRPHAREESGLSGKIKRKEIKSINIFCESIRFVIRNAALRTVYPVLARFKRRYEVKTNYGPPFKMFLFIFREASEKKIFKKMKFSGRLLPFFEMVILPCKISLKMLQNTKNGIAPPNGVQSKNQFHGWIRRWILTYLDPKSVSIPQKWPILDPCNFL